MGPLLFPSSQSLLFIFIPPPLAEFRSSLSRPRRFFMIRRSSPIRPAPCGGLLEATIFLTRHHLVPPSLFLLPIPIPFYFPYLPPIASRPSPLASPPYMRFCHIAPRLSSPFPPLALLFSNFFRERFVVSCRYRFSCYLLFFFLSLPPWREESRY